MQDTNQIFPDQPRWFFSWVVGMLTVGWLLLAQVTYWHGIAIILASAAAVSVIEVTRSCGQDECYERDHPMTLDTEPVEDQVELLWQVLDDTLGSRDVSARVVARYLAAEKEERVG